MSASAKLPVKNAAKPRKIIPLIPALVAVGSACGLAAAPAAALELGELTVHSELGQPLRASIAYALAPNEQLANYCIYLRPGNASEVIPVLSRAQISVTNNTINLAGSTVLREPMLSMQVGVDCPYTPHLMREYTIMLNPATNATPAPLSTSAPLPGNTALPTQSVSRAPEVQNSAPRQVATATAIESSTRYRVMPGDTASTIVARIENRSIGMWAAVGALLAANPDAFIDGDVNRIMAGKLLRIPDMLGSAPVDATSEMIESIPVDNNPVTEAGTTSIEISPQPEVVLEPAAEPVAGDLVTAEEVQDVAVNTVSGELDAVLTGIDDSAQLQPGDVVLTPVQSSEDIVVNTDIIIDDATATRLDPASAADNQTGVNGDWNWLAWLGGSGVAIIMGLLLFGRSFRERFGGTPGAVEIAGRRADDDPTQKTRVAADVDIQFEDTVNSQALALDADLGAGTGLQQGSEMDVAEDYGFVGTASVAQGIDLEVPEEITAEFDVSPTDIIPPQHQADVSSILTEEIPPEVDDTEYDMSMIVDATKQNLGDDDDTATDLQAVRLDAQSDDDTEDEGNYTLSQEVDYQVLEQDYEDELTATQALNAEVQKAAEELALRMQQVDDLDVTSELTAIERTTEMPRSDATQELPASGATEELPVADVTQEMPSADKTAEMPEVSDPENTAELTTSLPTSLEAENDADATDMTSATTIEQTAAGSDITVEMHIESGKVDTKKGK